MQPEVSSQQGAAQRMIEYLSALKLEALPAAVVAQAQWCLLDGLGCGLFGAGQPWGRIMRDAVFAEGSQGACTVFGGARTLAAAPAALCNGTAMHGFELDDLISSSVIHPGSVVVPAAIAAAEETNASGARLLCGIVVGYESMHRISLAMGMEPSHRGFHKTAVIGPVAAAVAAGVVMELNTEQMICAIGLACSAASGIKAFANGSGGGMVKRMHAGRAAEGGLRMSQLAQRGFTGPSAALDGRFGLLEVFGGEGVQTDHLWQGLGDSWAIDDVWVKVYPICGWIQGVVQLLLQLRGARTFTAAEIKKVYIGTSAFACKYNANPAPADTMEAQYSIPYCVALALTGDPGDPLVFNPEAVAAPGWRDIARRVEIGVDAQSEAVYPKQFGTHVQLHLADGSVGELRVLDAHGTPADPCAETELVAKFTRLARLAKLKSDPAAVVACVRNLHESMSVRELGGLLRTE